MHVAFYVVRMLEKKCDFHRTSPSLRQQARISEEPRAMQAQLSYTPLHLFKL